jgi:class 3 adenylate cyclase/tetratricopeptide (TPR) repeat protein
MSHEQRKTVTVVFCDLAGSTALGESVDPERLRGLLARYFEQMKAIVESHGGTVEKFIGDAVMAVFGVPVTHEDDALRAVRAAAEMRDALPALGLEGRIGVMTGEVVTGTEERLVTGDAVNVAARLESAAAPGEVLIGQPTLDLVHGSVEVEAVEPLELKGKTQPVAAFRLLAVGAAPERRHDTPFVGREREVALIREAWARVVAGQRCELVTIVGDAGVGKSRLVEEALASLDARALRGRCLPYGDGITYWPVVEVLKQLRIRPPDEAAAAAIGSLLGETDAQTSAEEIAWAFRKTLEQAAASQPLVVVFDDIQWGEQTFHDLIEHIALLSTGQPIMLACMARPELVERRPTWPVTLRLEPLPDTAVDALIPEQIPDNLRARITHAAGGNPLFVGEMLAMAANTHGDLVVPATLQALLAARLDQLDPAERAVLERGAVEGEIFHRGAVQALTDDDHPITPILAALARKQLIRPDKPQIAGDDGFRFRHLLLRDAAYDALPKATRADLHERLADWLEQRGVDVVEIDEILGYHLEQACHYRVELGLPTDDALAATASRRLAAAGRRARARGDERAAANLLQRAIALLPPTRIDLGAETDLVNALYWSGNMGEALRRADALADRAGAIDDRVAELCGRIKAAEIRLNVEPEGATERIDVLLEEALPELEAIGDDLALYTAHYARTWVALGHGRMDLGLDAVERAAVHGRRADVPYEHVGWRASIRLWGTTPVADLLAWLDELEPRHQHDYWLRASRARAVAMLGRFDEARAILAEMRAELTERGNRSLLAWTNGQESVLLELDAGRPAAAAQLGEEGCRQFEEIGEQAMLSTAAALLGQALYALDRLDEADHWAARAAEFGANDDILTQFLWRQVAAKVLARRGKHADAEALAREAVAIAEQTDMLSLQPGVYADLAEVLTLGGKPADAAPILERALELYERKGNLVGAERARERLTDLSATTP